MNNLTLLCGLPCSGKSTWAREISEDFGDIVIESDEYRARLFENKQGKEVNTELFAVIHDDIYNLLCEGKDVILDATNLSYKNRKALLNKIEKLNVHKTCVLFATPYATCLERNESRERQVPEDVIKRMREKFQCPLYSEGWDDIEIIYNYNPDNYIISDYLNIADQFNQENSHHTMTLGHHSTEVAELMLENKVDDSIYLVALLHDNGKLFTQRFTTFKGEPSTDAHYFGHGEVGAYESLFYLNNELTKTKEILFASGLITYHMRPYFAKTEKAKKKLEETVGSDMYYWLMLLNEADVKSH